MSRSKSNESITSGYEPETVTFAATSAQGAPTVEGASSAMKASKLTGLEAVVKKSPTASTDCAVDTSMPGRITPRYS